MSRSGFTLLELVVALIAATVLTASLAAAVMISTELLEVPPDEKSVWKDNAIHDRLASDLRFATDIDDTPSDGFVITRPDPATGASQSITYTSYMDGLTRQVDAGPAIEFDPQAPSPTFQVDGYTAPTDTDSDNIVRVRSTSHAESSGTTGDVDILLPPGCVNGDVLLLCISSKNPSSMWFSETGWQTVIVNGIDSLRQVICHQVFNDSMPDVLTINVSPDASIAAVMIALENADSTNPIGATQSDGSYAVSFLSFTHPTPLEPSSFSPGDLNVQVFAADDKPWSSGTLGIASFSDAAKTTGGSGTSESSIGVAVRTGAMPSLSSTPSLDYQQSGYWLQAGIRIEVAP